MSRLDELYQDLYNKRQRFIGYPVNQSFDYSTLFRFLDFSFNNYGDPFYDSNYSLNTHSIERTVVSTFAKLLGTDLNETWGYVTSGTTESHIFSLQAARDTFPEGIVYFSTSTHSSIGKAVRLLRMAYVVVQSLDGGEIDYRALECEIGFHLDKPAIIVVNIGTTMTGAIDSLPKIGAILDRTGVPGRYIHADAALSGMILPFVDSPQPFRFTDGLDSVAISGHKMIGSPLPCGVVLARRTYVTHLQQNGAVEYVRCMDTTVASSRSAFAPLILYHALRMHGVLDDEDELGDCGSMKAMVKKALDMAEYAVVMMNRENIPAWRQQNSLTVVFPRPTVQLERKWFLAATNDIAHMMVMPGITAEQIENLVSDLCAER
jgi:histidine decarboxylase